MLRTFFPCIVNMVSLNILTLATSSTVDVIISIHMDISGQPCVSAVGLCRCTLQLRTYISQLSSNNCGAALLCGLKGGSSIACCCF